MFATKNFKGKNTHYVLDFLINAMIMNFKIHNILDMIEISKSIEPNKFIEYFLQKC